MAKPIRPALDSGGRHGRLRGGLWMTRVPIPVRGMGNGNPRASLGIANGQVYVTSLLSLIESV